jgi:hypothetical protein
MLLDTIAFASEEAGSGFTMSEMWAHAGFIARSVIITLLLMGIACVVVWVERWLAFRKARQQSMDCAASIVSKFQQNDVAGALKIAQNEDYKRPTLRRCFGRGSLSSARAPMSTGWPTPSTLSKRRTPKKSPR